MKNASWMPQRGPEAATWMAGSRLLQAVAARKSRGQVSPAQPPQHPSNSVLSPSTVISTIQSGLQVSECPSGRPRKTVARAAATPQPQQPSWRPMIWLEASSVSDKAFSHDSLFRQACCVEAQASEVFLSFEPGLNLPANRPFSGINTCKRKDFTRIRSGPGKSTTWSERPTPNAACSVEIA